MLRLLIADDEPLILVGIKSLLDWNSLGAEIVAEAANGKIALEAAEKYRPDIIITDIKMPVMDGLELVEAVKARDIQAKFIVLSSYDDFRYVKQAMRLGVSDYWLKMELSEETVRETIKKLSLSINDSEKERRVLSQQSLPVLQELFFNNLLLSFFTSPAEIADEQKKCGINFDKNGMFILYIVIDDEILFKRREAAYNSRRLCTSVKDLVKTTFNEHGENYVFSHEEKKIAVLAGSKAGAQVFDKQLDEICADVVEYCRTYFNVRLCVGISEVICDMTDFLAAFSQAKFAVHQYFYDASIAVCRFIRPEISSESENELLTQLQKNIALAFERNDVVAACEKINELANLLSTRKISRVQVLNTCFNVVQYAATLFVNGNAIVDQALPGLENRLINIYNLNTVEDVKTALLSISGAIADYAVKQQDHGKDRFIHSIRTYIDGHLHEPLSMNGAAEFMCMSPTYFCSLFKKHLGLNFTEYVNAQKIAKAKNLLLSGSYKIFEIADALGFDNAYYFSKVFKKVAGCSPSDYLEELSPRK